MLATEPRVSIWHYVPIEIKHFIPDRRSPVSLYLRFGGRYVLFTKASTAIDGTRQRRLLDAGVVKFYFRVSDGRLETGDATLQDVLMAPEDEVPSTVKAGLLYGAATSAAQLVYAAPEMPENLSRAREMVGSINATLAQGPAMLHSLVRMMSHEHSVYCHAVNVATYSVAIANKLGLSRKAVTSLGTGAFLHDIGKLRINDSVLQKPGPLSEDEWVEMRHHPEWGAELLGRDVRSDPVVVAIVQQHQERLDRSGYPYHLARTEIDPAALIVAAADVYDALTGNRPYRRPLSPFGALHEIKHEMSGQIDRSSYEALVRVLGPSESPVRHSQAEHPSLSRQILAFRPPEQLRMHDLSSVPG
jgi:putative nucleotidyltransferase with HDIG domain